MAKKQKTEAPEVTPDTEQTPAETNEAAAPDAELENRLTASLEEAAKNWDLYLRTRADLDNYRKRAQREKEDLGRFANENLLRELLPVVDNLERAVAHARESGTGDGSLLEGVEMTLGQLRKVFERSGVTAVEAVGKPFDPSCHEAMGQLESDELPPGSVIQELQKGYLLNQRLLRPAMVMVSKAPAAENPGQNA
ncbi:nucleotide exchange factor GrpE [Desulfuromonas carbonis]|uniref:nucleotide exchange factor GrpE n=1 Tax=Desulfuromonas sp. DDH964 TaxID=1823759 RepID=UPI00078D3F2F|nr:nucleotide exchange factor GrpE [Desulfuromonas sp. DDH964]AMV70785.1 heat shock protein GrpE [Desulfuromonas sp. DDH964]